MKFFFPDSQDLVSPAYDFMRDEYPAHRVRQRDDRYAHEVLDHAPYHGILVSKSIVDGSIKGAGKYTTAQRARMHRMGVHKFFRLPPGVEALGDNGAFNYIDEPTPPVTPAQTLSFYEECGFDAGVSTDHVVFGFTESTDGEDANPDWEARRRLTLRLAEEFMSLCRDRASEVEPVGAAQGWSPATYADSVRALQDMGYQRIALGGMVPLKTREILASLDEIGGVLKSDTHLHLLGITRVESMDDFAALGVTSFDSTSAFRQAFMDDRKNFHTPDRAYVAIRVPQVDGNPTLKRAILAGHVSQTEAISAERETLKALRAYDGSAASRRACLDRLEEYSLVCRTKKSYRDAYEETLAAAPWTRCSCKICRDHGVEIAIFRGTERNKRRGFHNMSVLATKMAQLKSHRSTNG
ncbi:queuine/other tRNA-ribosyltransferase [Nocardioides sp. S5]|uniref:tRNA-guanine transglycosylase DpdA n=1 Tax=Nocardioides sp. S5 TaxID=2017486 RepID=UPI001A8FE858|nr:tRNA-guanine transglycosylase DpdA [Nocardioides sp. S5]QSR30846.1 queuine/other tRNA-ribosyltransferase [Nocardioides sp. S5]